MPQRPRLTLALAATCTALAACSSTTKVGIVVDPKQTSIYINGKKQGTGKRVYDFDFSKHPRAVLQATAYGCRPHFEIWTPDRLAKHISEFQQIELILEQER